MKKMFYKLVAYCIISGILSSLFIWDKFGLFSPIVNAASENALVTDNEEGDNITWEMISADTLMLFGNGAMKDYFDFEETPWHSQKSSLKSVIISEGITKIGSYAFNGCFQLGTIIIPKSVVEIGGDALSSTKWLAQKQSENPLVIVNDILIDGTKCKGDVIIPDNISYIVSGAFYNSSKITSITLPAAITEINHSVFYNCTGLTSIVIPEGVTTIKDCAFQACKNLNSITFPESVSRIECWAFSGTAWLSARQSESPFVVINDILIDGHNSTGDVVIPDNVKKIGVQSFSRNGYTTNLPHITSIKIPQSVIEIQNGAFYSCNELQTVTIPSSVRSIEASAFCYCKNLKDVYIENPYCRIDDEASVICNKYNNDMPQPFVFTGTIHGHVNSTAQRYAEKWGYFFEPLEEIETTTTSITINELTTTTETTTEPSLTVFGDVDGDGMITAFDAQLVLTYFNEVVVLGFDPEESVLSPEQAVIADVDLDGELTAFDATMILTYFTLKYNTGFDDLTWYELIGNPNLPDAP